MACYPSAGNMKLLPPLLLKSVVLTILYCLEFLRGVASESPLIERCPGSCTCFHSDSLGGTVVNCSTQELTAIPVGLPENVAELLADHNSLEQLSPLPALKHLRRLNLKSCRLKELIAKDNKVIDSNALPNLQILDLAENELTTIPHDLPSSLQMLHLGHNKIETIQTKHLTQLTDLQELFLNHNLITLLTNNLQAPLPKLQRLALNDNLISQLEAGTFQSLDALIALSLSRNRIDTLHEKTFSGLHELKHLDLSRNQLTIIPKNTFKRLESLKHLYLNNNRLTTVPWGLPMMEWLDLSNNLLNAFPEEFKFDLFPTEVFNIAGNPLFCDCHMLWLKELYDRREYLFKHINVDSNEFIPICHGPESVAGDSWDLLSDALFVCAEGTVKTEGPGPIIAPPLAAENGRSLGQLVVKCGLVTDSTIEVYWNMDNAMSFTSLHVHYYVFGKREKTSKFTQVSTKKLKVTVGNLRPETNYVVCLIPKLAEVDPEKLAPLSLDHCIETRTKEPPPVLIISYLTVFWYYFLGMLATVIAIFSCIGCLALIYGILSTKTDWSAKYTNPGMDAQDAQDGVSSASHSANQIIKSGDKQHVD